MAVARFTYRVEGLRELQQALRQVPQEAENQKRVMHEAGMLVVRAVRAPVRSGALAATARAGKGKTKAVVRVGRGRTNDYARVQNYGRSWRSGYGKNNNFLNIAADSQEPAVIEHVTQGLYEILRRNGLNT